MPRVLNLRRDGPFSNATSVYVGRPSRWGNPFAIGDECTRDEAVERYERWARAKLNEDPSWLEPLRDKDLICYCAPLKCHADVLLRLLEERYGVAV